MSSPTPPLRGTAEWSANREVALLLGLAGGNRYAAQQLWLRKRSALRRRPRRLRVQDLRRQASSLLAAEPSRPRLRHRACPSGARLPSSPRSRGASTRSTSRARCGRACVSGEQAARLVRASARSHHGVQLRRRDRPLAQSQIHPPPTVGRARRSDLDRFVEHAASLGLREAVSATVGDSGWDERLWPAFGSLWRLPILVGRLLLCWSWA